MEVQDLLEYVNSELANGSNLTKFAKGLGKNAYGKYGGGSVVFLVEGTNIAIDFAGSINQIKTQGLEIINQFKIVS